MSRKESTLCARLMVRTTCPSCHADQFLAAVDGPTAETQVFCSACGTSFRAAVDVVPATGRSSLQLFELWLDRWLREVVPLCRDVASTDVAAHVTASSTAPTPPPAGHELLPDVSSLLTDLPTHETAHDPATLTSYSMGSSTGIDEIARLLKADPANRQLKEWLAFAYYRNEALKDAVKVYLELVEEDPGDVNSHYYLANAYYKLGFGGAAAKEWERVITLAPQSPLADKARKRVQKAA